MYLIREMEKKEFNFKYKYLNILGKKMFDVMNLFYRQN